jgi:hypothetical protein
MFKQRLRPSTLTREVILPGLIWAGFFVGLVAVQMAAPALAKHDDFLFGEGPVGRPWDGDLPSETSIVLAPLMQKQRQAIVALYVAPVLLGVTDNLSAAELKRRARGGLELLPALSVKVKKKTSASSVRGAAVSAAGDIPKPLLIDSLQFLRWRLEYFAGEKSRVTAEVRDYLARYNMEAAKQGTPLCNDLLALSADFGRQERYLDQDNLLALSHYLTNITATKMADQAESDAVTQYERHVAQAYTMAQLDRREEASNHFSQAINYLRPQPKEHRPQTDNLRKALLRVVDENLIKYETEMREHKNKESSNRDLSNRESSAGLENNALPKLSEDDRNRLKQDINRLVDIAYLAKIDRRLGEAAYLFRRAFLLIDYYLPGEQKDFSGLYYDLGETLLWDEKFDDSVYYLTLCEMIRSKYSPMAVTAIDTNNLLGRARLSQGQAKKAQDIFFDDLAMIAKRIKLKDVAITDDSTANARSLVARDALIQALLAYFPTAGADERRQIEGGVQGVIDSAIPLKQYDVAMKGDEALLKLRNQAVPVSDSATMIVLWGMTYACDCSERIEEALKYYNRLIDSFGVAMPDSAAYWYHGRGLDYDMLNKHNLAAKDFKRAIALYQKKLSAEQDDDTRDRLSWTIADLQGNLKIAHKYPATRPDYAALPDNCRWRAGRFPLKIFVDPGKERGFGGELDSMVREAVATWRDYDGSPIKVEYVDNLSRADIFIERVTVYDDIPYGSAGRTSATFEHKGEVATKILTKAHVRIYCPSFDGNDWENQDVKMSSFAKIQFKTLLIHELGHAFGLAHSPAGPDIMYWKSCAHKLSERDINTVNSIYKGARSRKSRHG